MKSIKYLIISAILLLSGTNAFAVISVEVAPQDELRPFVTIDKSNYPDFRIRVRITRDGNYIPASRDNLLIIENNKVSIPKDVIATGDDWYDVSWSTRLRGTVSNAILLTFEDTDIAINPLQHAELTLSQIRLRTADNQNLDDLNLGYVSAGSTVARVLRMYMLTGLKDFIGDEIPVPVDSITTETEYFTWDWIGGVGGENPPPGNYLVGFNYNFILRFNPDDYRYYRDRLTIHYYGGQKEFINIYANFYPIEADKKVKLLYPNGNEKFAPCEKVTIRWTGTDPNVPSFVEFSPDGINWQVIGTTPDTSMVWQVPATPTQYAKIRIRQIFQKDETRILLHNNAPVDQVAFNSTGTILASANQQAEIVEWNMTDDSKGNIFRLDDIEFQFENYNILGLGYLEDDDEIFIGYYKVRGRSGPRVDSFAVVNRESGNIDRFSLPSGFVSREILVGPNGTKIAFVPVAGQEVKIFDVSSRSFESSVVFPAPISSFAFNKELSQAAVALYNGEVRLLSTADFSLIRTFDMSFLPIILQMALSPNGKFLALGHQVSQTAPLISKINQFNLVEIATGNVIRTYRALAENSVGLEFNPLSSVLLIGGQNSQQITFWDLVSDTKNQLSDIHSQQMSDFDYSPAGSTIASSSGRLSDDNIRVRKFSFAESDDSDNFFEIIQAELDMQPLIAGEKLLGSENIFELNSALCNNGEVKVILDEYEFGDRIHFDLAEELVLPDTLDPGECLPLKIIFNPIEIGELQDSIVFSSCQGRYVYDLKGIGLPRNIEILDDPFDFGDVCVGDTVERVIQLARNMDPIDLIANGALFQDAANSSFSVIEFSVDSSYAPGEIISAKIRFIPAFLGENYGELRLFHSNQGNYFETINFRGVGIGPGFDVNHTDLYFIPEILTRTLTVINTDVQDITIDRISITPQVNYSFNANLPVTLSPGETYDFLVSWSGIEGEVAEYLEIVAEPCNVTRRVNLGIYTANSIVSLPEVEADPAEDDARIDISVQNFTGVPYDGERFFEMGIKVNPRIFLPLEVESEYGTGELISNDIINDERIFVVRIEGEIPESGIVGTVKGVAGLAEVDIAPLIVDMTSTFWGENVTVTGNDGEIRLINVCGDRRIRRSSVPAINYIAPNPSDGRFTISVEAIYSETVTLSIIDNLGNTIKQFSNFELKVGTNELDLDVSGISSGNYRLILKSPMGVSSRDLLIVN